MRVSSPVDAGTSCPDLGDDRAPTGRVQLAAAVLLDELDPLDEEPALDVDDPAGEVSEDFAAGLSLDFCPDFSPDFSPDLSPEDDVSAPLPDSLLAPLLAARESFR
jgi:hypothetical protein